MKQGEKIVVYLESGAHFEGKLEADFDLPAREVGGIITLKEVECYGPSSEHTNSLDKIEIRVKCIAANGPCEK